MTDPTPQNQSDASLRRRRDALIRRLPPLDALLRGSLIERFARCGKPNCKCADGPGHGPKYFLSVSMPGTRPQQVYVAKDRCDEVRDLLENQRAAHEIIEEICEINRELLRRKSPF